MRTKYADVDLGGSMRKFLERIGITHGGPELRRFKQQARSLAVMRCRSATKQNSKLIQVNTQPVERFEAWLHADPRQGQL